MPEFNPRIDPGTFVDPERYPLLHPNDQHFVESIHLYKSILRRQGYSELHGFLTESGLSTLLQDANSLLPYALSNAELGSVYADPEIDNGFPEGHPRRIKLRESMGTVPYTAFPKTSPLRQLYEWQPLMDFLGPIFGDEGFFRYADELGALNLTVMYENDLKQWHFDQNDFGVTLTLQAAKSGGEFEIAPFVRSDSEENYNFVKKILDGSDYRRIRKIPVQPGSLILFNGRQSLHRVTTINGPQARLVAVFAYDGRSRARSTTGLRVSRYGDVRHDKSSYH
jgi:hypothetical protein